MSGVPLAEATSHDTINVRAALIRRMGSANLAIVWQMIHFRTAPASPYAYERDGRLWWRAKRDDIAAATGLTVDQARRSCESLEQSGYIATERHMQDGVYDQTRSYRTVVITPDDVAPVPDEHSASVPNVPSSQEVEEQPLFDPIEQAFDEAWKHWPKKVERKQALQRFRAAAKRVGLQMLTDQIVRFGDAYTATTQKKFVPALGVWINGDRWTDELPQADRPQGSAQPVRSMQQFEAERAAILARNEADARAEFERRNQL